MFVVFLIFVLIFMVTLQVEIVRCTGYAGDRAGLPFYRPVGV
jgi:hypothetical protein